MANRKQSSFRIRCSSAEKQLFQGNAKLQRLSLSEYVRLTLMDASSGKGGAHHFYRQQCLSWEMRTKLQVVQILIADSDNPRLHSEIAQLLELTDEMGP